MDLLVRKVAFSGRRRSAHRGYRGSRSLGCLVGFATLFGITLHNSIMVISHYEQLVDVEGMGWGLDTMIRGASERLAPILMTALVTGLGLLPLAIGSGDPGREIEDPMAIAILGDSQPQLSLICWSCLRSPCAMEDLKRLVEATNTVLKRDVSV
jgi:Cu/Ag efflux pump CusA